MLLPSLVNHDCPVYQKIISKLLENLNAATINNTQKKALLLKFSRNYLTPKELWQTLKRSDESSFSEIQLKPINNPEYHFFSEWSKKEKILEPESISQSILQILENPCSSPYIKLYVKDELCFEALKYPHSKLEESFMKLEEISSSFLPFKLKKEVEKIKDLFKEIKSNEKNSQKWFQRLQKVEDHEFIKNNVEFRLGKKLWKLYINYLQVAEPKLMIHTYSKYCRLFLSDLQMKKEYMKATNENDFVGLEWNNLFKFENSFNKNNGTSLESEEIKKHEKYGSAVSSNRKENFIPDLDYSGILLNNLKNQNFPLPKPIIRYILSKADDFILTQLHKSCKYFYIQKPKLICYRLAINNGEKPRKFVENSLVTNKVLPFKLHVSQSLKIRSAPLPTPTSNISKIIQQSILQCAAKYIDFFGALISEKDFNFLVNHGGVEVISFKRSGIFNGGFHERRHLVIEEILSKLPKIKSYTSNSSFYYTPTSPEALAKLNFQNKLLNFDISPVFDDFNPKYYVEFIKKNAAPYSKYSLAFSNVDQNAISHFKQIIFDFSANWNHPYGVELIFKEE